MEVPDYFIRAPRWWQQCSPGPWRWSVVGTEFNLQGPQWTSVEVRVPKGPGG